VGDRERKRLALLKALQQNKNWYKNKDIQRLIAVDTGGLLEGGGGGVLLNDKRGVGRGGEGGQKSALSCCWD